MTAKDFEFMEGLELPTDAEFEDHLRVLEDEAAEIYHAQFERSEINADDEARLFIEWKRKNVHPKPDFKLPPPGVIGGVACSPTLTLDPIPVPPEAA